MSRKFALVIGNTEYTDPGLVQLAAPSNDAADFARVLSDRALCAFDNVKVMLNQPSQTVVEAVDEFFDQRKPDDLLVLYFSGHGVRDELGSLYLAFKNTLRNRLRATALKSDYIREAMDQSRSKRQVVVLDCCNSGAFPQGTKAEIGGPMGMLTALQGYGRFVLMASDATQFAWEGDRVIGEAKDSLFTHFLVKGLEGEADMDGDGNITVDELYDYAFDQISRITQKQSPTKAASKVEGDIVLRRIMSVEDIRPMPLPADLLDEAQDPRPYVREAAVVKLDKIMHGKNLALARSAAEALEQIVEDENTTRRVAQAANQALLEFRQREREIAGESTMIEPKPTLAAAPAESGADQPSAPPAVPAQTDQPVPVVAKGQDTPLTPLPPMVQPPVAEMNAPSAAIPVSGQHAGAVVLPMPADPPRVGAGSHDRSSNRRTDRRLLIVAPLITLLVICGCAAIALPRVSPAVKGFFSGAPAAVPSATDTSTSVASSPIPTTTRVVASRTPATGSAATAQAPRAVVRVNNVKAREGPDLRFPPVKDLPLGTTCDLVGHWYNWYVVNCNGTPGWVYADWITIPPGVQLETVNPVSTPEITHACKKYCH